MQSIIEDNNYTVMTEKEARVSILESIQEDLVRIYKEIDLITSTIDNLEKLLENENRAFKSEYRKIICRLKDELGFAQDEKQKRLEDFYYYCTN